jgi:signal transduction histidine kinase
VNRLGVTRIPIRARLALACLGVFAITLAAVGSFLYLQTKQNLDDAIDRSLRTRAQTLTSLGPRPDALRLADSDFQLLRTDNTVAAASRHNERASLLSPTELRQAGGHPLFLWRGETARLLARPTGSATTPVLVVGSSLQQREHAMEGLARSLLIGGPLALIIAAAAGYWLAGRALRPVEQMRQRAGTISQLQSDQRLPLPVPRDEIHRLGETLNAMLDRLERASLHERQFVADASHELRTPLARLRSELELARGEIEVSALHASVDSAIEETERLCALADDLLTLAFIDENASHRATSVDLSGLAVTCAQRCLGRLEAQGRALRTAIEPGVRVHGDETRLRQALDNLMENAFLHGAGIVTVTLHASGSNVEATIRDEGAGFDLSYLPHAFDRFQRPAKSRQADGTGLGLAIVQAIAQSHGGRGEVGNHPAGGGTATLVLPLLRSG